MATNFKYPRVNISTIAKIHSVKQEVREDTTVLFQPICSNRGPVDKIVKLYTTDDFTRVFGEPDYRKQGQTVLNTLNWLKYGGTVYACRIVAPGSTIATCSTIDGETVKTVDGLTAKYPGSYYNDIDIKLSYTKKGDREYNCQISIGDYESFGPTSDINTLISYINEESEYISIDTTSFLKYFNGHSESTTAATEYTIDATLSGAVDGGLHTKYKFKSGHSIEADIEDDGQITVTINGIASIKLANQPVLDAIKIVKYASGAETDETGSISKMVTTDSIGDASTIAMIKSLSTGFPVDSDTLIRNFFGTINSDGELDVNDNGIAKVLSNELETPIDIILDAGYSKETKKVISKYTDSGSNLENIRPDIIVIFDKYCADIEDFEYTGKKPSECSIDDCISKGTNRAVYTQYFLTDDSVITNIYVTPTYSLARLIPHNDNLYGIQWPTAGLTRGVITGVKDLNLNPSPSQKNAYFLERINYIERDINGCKFMSQRTYDGSDETEYTALSFLNNSRCVAKMVKDLKKLAREYLFEFNDAITLSNMRTALNNYIGGWITNRTLNYGIVDVAPSKYSEEAIDVTLNIRFTGTIEVISVNIIIE